MREVCLQPALCFSPCHNYDFKESTLRDYKQQAISAKDAHAELEDQYQKIYGDNGILTAKLQRNRKIVAAKSIVATDGCRRSGGLCGTCSSCADPIFCGKCSSCSDPRDGRCAFAPCLAYDYKPNTLSIFVHDASSAKTGDTGLEEKFNELYGVNGHFASKLKNRERTHRAEAELRKKAVPVGGRCGNCSSCTDPMACGKCITCRDPHKGKCVFALCLEYDYSEITLTRFRDQAHSIKVDEKRFERQFDLLYGPEGVFASKSKSKTESKGHLDRKLRSRCGIRSQAILNDQLVDTSKRSMVYDIAEASPRSVPYSCGRCSSCCSPFSCQVCYRCKAEGRCIFNLCQNYAYKDSTMEEYKLKARQAVEISKDKN